MHCINCGTQNLETTRYCKSCGANLEVLRQALTQNVSTAPLSLIGPRHVGLILVLSSMIGLGGLAIVFSIVLALSKSIGPSLGHDVLPLLFFLGLVGTAGVCFIVWSLLRMLRIPAGKTVSAAAAVPQASLESAPARALSDFSEPVPSVVEHTTSRLGNYAPPEREGR